MSDRPPYPSDDDWGRWPEPPRRAVPRPRPQTPQPPQHPAQPARPQPQPAQTPGEPPPRQVRRPSSVPIGRPLTNRPGAPETQPPVNWSNLYTRPHGHQTASTYPPRNRTSAPASPQSDLSTSEWDAVRQPAPGYSPPTSLPPDYPDQLHRTGELPAVEVEEGLAPDWPAPSWPEYQASLAYSDDLEEPERQRRRRTPILLGLLLLAGGAAGGAVWLNRDGGVEVTDTSAGRGQASSAVAESTTAPTTEPDTTTTTTAEEPENTPAGSSDDPTDGAGSGGDSGETTETSAPAEEDGDGGGADDGSDDSGGSGDGGGSGGSGAGSPTEAIEAMFAATNAADCPALIDSVSASSREMFGSTRDDQISQCEQTMGYAPAADMAIQSSSITSETASEATVSVTYTQNGESTTEDFSTVLEDTGWKVDLAAGF